MASSLSEIQITKGDITHQSVDVIVNAANSALAGGGGVDGAIHRAAGPALMAACRKWGECPTGQARLTPGFELPAKWVIHAVGPIWHGCAQNEDQLLASCYRQALQIAAEKNFSSIAFSAISCGVYGYPLRAAARIAIGQALSFRETNSAPELIRFVLFNDELKSIFQDVFQELATA